MKINLKSGEVILFDKEKPILLQVIEITYFKYNKYDEYTKFFLNSFMDCKIKHDFEKYQDHIFFFNKNDQYLGEYNLKHYEFWIDYTKIWSIFKNKFGLSHQKIKILTKYLIKTHFKLKCEITSFTISSLQEEVETHFKLV